MWISQKIFSHPGWATGLYQNTQGCNQAGLGNLQRWRQHNLLQDVTRILFHHINNDVLHYSKNLGHHWNLKKILCEQCLSSCQADHEVTAAHMKNFIRFHPFVVHRWWSNPHNLPTPSKAAANNSDRILSLKQNRGKMTQTLLGAFTGVCWEQRTRCSRFSGPVPRVRCATAWWFTPCDLHRTRRQDHELLPKRNETSQKQKKIKWSSQKQGKN